ETLELLREIGATQAQGYYFSAPLPIEQLVISAGTCGRLNNTFFRRRLATQGKAYPIIDGINLCAFSVSP
ncbi:hypothetical protein F2S71_24780, partial [Pseudomonas syringae pv. actinidiae]|nr:hypothetical protein [Pseudomonas syringae pv. actinidiae]